jgi:hypothetical protein
MRKEKKILKMLRYICLSCVIVFGLMTIVGTGGSGGSDDNTTTTTTTTTTNGTNIVGTWTLEWDWECDGEDGTADLYFHADNTWFIDYEDGLTGTWTLEGDQVTFVFSSGTTYTGTVNSTGTEMEGTMVDYDGITGCWTASLTTRTRDLTSNEALDSAGILFAINMFRLNRV